MAKVCSIGPFEFHLDERADDVRRDGRQGVLQPGQLSEVRGRQQLRPCRQQLTELDERRTQLFQRKPKVGRAGEVRMGVGLAGVMSEREVRSRSPTSRSRAPRPWRASVSAMTR